MTKKIAVINDLSGFGKCSLTAALPVISVMGSQVCPLPTALLSAQTGYPDYYMDDCTDRMDHFREKWAQMGESFDGIYTGFVANEAQIDHIFTFLDTFRREGTFLLVDPVLGDDGVPYPIFTEQLLTKMRKLTSLADIITPNLTELCLLAGKDPACVRDLSSAGAEDKITDIVRGLNHGKTRTVIVTGIQLGTDRIGNLICTPEESRLISFPRIGGSFSGTGDLFASVLAGGIARGEDIFSLCELAGNFIACSMKDSLAAGVERNAGTEFEQNLRMLLPLS